MGEKILWQKEHHNAVAPSKKRDSDSGYDVTIVSIAAQWGRYTLFDTGIRVVPPDGFYFDLLPRSSFWDKGYVMTNSTGVIDKTYRGTLKVGLFKIDPDAPDLVLPSKLFQIVPRAFAHFETEEADVLAYQSERGEGGFGSTDKIELPKVPSSNIEISWEEGALLKKRLAAVLEGRHEDSVGFAIRYLLYDFFIQTGANKEQRKRFFDFVDAVVSAPIDKNPDPNEKRWSC
jgi:deoxyuridine 5'-triphosphate nucleotidohydrolase